MHTKQGGGVSFPRLLQKPQMFSREREVFVSAPLWHLSVMISRPLALGPATVDCGGHGGEEEGLGS